MSVQEHAIGCVEHVDGEHVDGEHVDGEHDDLRTAGQGPQEPLGGSGCRSDADNSSLSPRVLKTR